MHSHFLSVRISQLKVYSDPKIIGTRTSLSAWKFQPEKKLPKILSDLFRVKIRLKWAIIQCFRCSKILNKCSENSRSQIVFRTDIFRKLTLGPSFLRRHCTTTTWNFLIRCVIEVVNTRRRVFVSFSKPEWQKWHFCCRRLRRCWSSLSVITGYGLFKYVLTNNMITVKSGRTFWFTCIGKMS